MDGEFKGTVWLVHTSTERKPGHPPKPWFRYWLDPLHPMTFVCADGTFLRCANTGTTDFGSVPPEFQSLVGPLDCAKAYIFHDSAFTNHGHWESYDRGATWVFVPMSMRQVNDNLFMMARAEGVDWLESQEMHVAVDAGGGPWWAGHVGPCPVDPPPVTTAQYLFDSVDFADLYNSPTFPPTLFIKGVAS